MAIATINPATAQVLKTFEALTDSQVDQKIERAAKTFPAFHKLPFAERARMMINAAEILENEKASLAKLMTTEMGKTLRSAEEEAVKSAWGCRYYAEHAERFLADEVVETPASRSFILLPTAWRHSVVMPGIIPSGRFRFIALTTVGNVGILKHASKCAAMRDEDRRNSAACRILEGAFQTLDYPTRQQNPDDLRGRRNLNGSEGAGVQVGSGGKKN
jgi:succinate-semialdehyde dehydrogenase/glutarate-semialdehyde dehydrogenase